MSYAKQHTSGSWILPTAEPRYEEFSSDVKAQIAACKEASDAAQSVSKALSGAGDCDNGGNWRVGVNFQLAGALKAEEAKNADLAAQVQSLQRQLASSRALNDAIEARCNILSSIAAKVPGLEKQVAQQKAQISDLETEKNWNDGCAAPF